MMKKVLDIMRYIFCIPIAYLGSRLLYMITYFFSKHIGIIPSNYSGVYGLSNIGLMLFESIICTIVFVFIIYYLLPKYKIVFAIIGSLLYSIIFVYVLFFGFINYDNIQAADNYILNVINSILTLLTLVICNIIFAFNPPNHKKQINVN